MCAPTAFPFSTIEWGSLSDACAASKGLINVADLGEALRALTGLGFAPGSATRLFCLAPSGTRSTARCQGSAGASPVRETGLVRRETSAARRQEAAILAGGRRGKTTFTALEDLGADASTASGKPFLCSLSYWGWFAEPGGRGTEPLSPSERRPL